MQMVWIDTVQKSPTQKKKKIVLFISIGIGSDSDDETSIADLKAMRKCLNFVIVDDR